MDQFSEVRINHFDDIEGCWCVDAWKTADDNEEGKVVAKIYEKSPIEFKVVWCDENLKNNPQINEEIDAFIQDKLSEFYACGDIAKDRNGKGLLIGQSVKWHDPQPIEGNEDRVFRVDDIINEEMVLISDEFGSAEVPPQELEIF